MLSRSAAAALLLILAPVVARAHHGEDFLLLESPSVPHPGNVYLLTNARAALESGADEQAELEPALLFGLTPRLSFELHAHGEKARGEGWDYEATAPAVHLLLTDPARHEGLKLGIGVEYEIGAGRGTPDNFETRLSAEYATHQAKWGGNLIYSHEQGSNGDLGAAFAYRRELGHGLALGAEFQGSFQRAAEQEFLLGAYYEHGQLWALKFGLGSRRDQQADATATARLGLVLRLKD